MVFDTDLIFTIKFFGSVFIIFYIRTHLRLAKLDGLPQAEVFLKHTKWRPISRRVVRSLCVRAYVNERLTN